MRVEHIGEATLYLGDCRESMRSMDAESVQCVVTSPPYWGLRDYGIAGVEWADGWIGSHGLEPTPEMYVAHELDVFREVRRVLADDGTVWLNLGDSYAQTGGSGPQGLSLCTRPSSIKHNRDRKKQLGGHLKPKDLVGIPWLVALALQADGWYLRQDIIWHKPNPMPESVTDRCTKAHEYLFLLSKSARYYYDVEAIREESLTGDARRPYGSPGANALDSRDSPQGNGQLRKIKIPGGWDTTEGSHGTIHGNGRTSAEYQQAAITHGRNKRSVWTVPTQPYSAAHFATFPPKLIEPCILAGSRPGDTVLDPFGGSGTTAGVALEHGRRAVLCELSEEYGELVQARIESITDAYRQPRLFDNKPSLSEQLELPSDV